MQENIKDIVEFLNPLLTQLSAAEMSKLNKKVGADLRRSQQQRIAAQKNPDGSSYSPRRLREGNRIRRKMFTKLKSTKYLRNFSNANGATVGFLSSVNRIATVHQFGLKDRVERNQSFSMTYPKRELLGFSKQDIQTIKKSVFDHLKI